MRWENRCSRSAGIGVQLRRNTQKTKALRAPDWVLAETLRREARWSLKLEADGITGEGMSFSPKEKERAQAVTYNIKNYIQGNIQDSQIQIEAENSTQTKSVEFDVGQVTKLIEALKSTIDVVGIDQQGKQELQSEIQTLEAQAKSPKPKNSIIAESLSSVRRILEGATGNLVASGLLNQIGTLFGV
jgi:hypothetical protein